MKLRNHVLLGLALVGWVGVSVAFFVLNGRGHLTHDQVTGWLK